MIRFCKKNLLSSRQLEKIYEISPIMFDNNIWEKGKFFFKYRKEEFPVLPVSNQMGGIICYAYQDNEANRELRMIQELRNNDNSLKFSDVFPDYGCVMIQGCNELAYYCAEYLKEQGIEIKVLGDYWEFLGYPPSCESSGKVDFFIYAEGIRPKKEWYHNFLTSVSVEFECIDKIYEKNLLYSKIRDTNKSYYELLSTLHNEDNIVIIGDGVSSQDTYDLLLSEGIDIYGFLVKNRKCKRLFGKPILQFEELEKIKNPILIQCTDQNSALGSKEIDRYDYYGYRRNETFFVIKDYTNIPDSNLINVLNDKKIILLGDHKLCEILKRNLMRKTKAYIRSLDTLDEVAIDPQEIVLLVKPVMRYNAKSYYYEESLKQLKLDKKCEDYTDYFSRHEAFAVMDATHSKYVHTNLRPKGILLGKSKGLSGNAFVEGILDGHPNILLIRGDFSFNIFWYCIRLGNVSAEDIGLEFWKMYEEENDEEVIKKDFPNKNKFIEKIDELIEKGKYYTAQEVFVLLHIAYSAMWNEKKETDIGQTIIYWEPHIGTGIPENGEIVSYFARWLESNEIRGLSMTLCRNAIIRGGSHIERFGITPKDRNCINRLQMVLFSKLERCNLQYKYWKEFFMRFEDIKLNPKGELEKICQVMDIPWSDTMLQTTDHEKIDSLFGVTGFDLGPVYNVRDNYLSAFDRMKIALGSADIQRMYGYPSLNIMNFSRRELQEIFLKLLRVQSEIEYRSIEEYVDYSLKLQRTVRDHLWKARKEALLQCIQNYNEWIAIDKNLFYRVLSYVKRNIYSDDVVDTENDIFRWIYIYQSKIDNLMTTLHYIKGSDKIILYGTGRDAEGLLGLLDQADMEKIIFGDKKALEKEIFFNGKRVVTVHEIAEKFYKYPILITPSSFFQEIEKELLVAGISKSRIKFNTFGFTTNIVIGGVAGRTESFLKDV